MTLVLDRYFVHRLLLKIGDRIELTRAQFERLAKAFFAEIESKFIRSAGNK